MSLEKRSRCEDSDEDDESCYPIVKSRRLQPGHFETEKHDCTAPSLSVTLATAVPTSFIPAEIIEYLRNKANMRFGMAEAAGIHTQDVAIGNDCLPMWANMRWEEERGDLHTYLQHQLIHDDISRGIGDLLLKEIVQKGNQKLSEACQRNIPLSSIAFDDSLLPTWPEPAVAGSTDEDETVETLSESPSSLEISEIIHTEIETVTNPSSFNVDYLSDEDTRDVLSSPNSATSYDDEDFMSVIKINNDVSPQPEYCEPNGHIVHDVEFVGGEQPSYYGGIEVYLAEDDIEITELSEVELAIDGTEWEYHFGETEVVEVVAPGANVNINTDINDGGATNGGHETNEPAEAAGHAYTPNTAAQEVHSQEEHLFQPAFAEEMSEEE